MVTVRLVRRWVPAAVRRAASRPTGKTQRHHLQQLYCTMKLLAIPPSLDIRFISVILLVSSHVRFLEYALIAFSLKLALAQEH